MHKYIFLLSAQDTFNRRTPIASEISVCMSVLPPSLYKSASTVKFVVKFYVWNL